MIDDVEYLLRGLFAICISSLVNYLFISFTHFYTGLFFIEIGELFICFIIYKFIYFYLFIFGCVGSSLLRAGFLQLQRAGATLHCGVRASHCGGFSCCGAWALGVQASVVVARRLCSCGLRALERRRKLFICFGYKSFIRHVIYKYFH